jgi:hypothetical protein
VERKRGQRIFVHSLRTEFVLLATGASGGSTEDPQLVHMVIHKARPDIHRVIDRLINRHR